MHAVNGLCIANHITNRHLEDYKKKLETEGTEEFYSMYDAIRNEYPGQAPVIVTLADIVFDGNLSLDLGIGSCWVNHFPPTETAKAFNLPENEKVALLLPIGYPAGDAVPAPMHAKKKDMDELVKYL